VNPTVSLRFAKDHHIAFGASAGLIIFGGWFRPDSPRDEFVPRFEMMPSDEWKSPYFSGVNVAME
jgi:hypothetical protein